MHRESESRSELIQRKAADYRLMQLGVILSICTLLLEPIS